MTALAPLTPLHGSYQPEDCQFLLTPIEAEYLSIEEKERRIQTGQAHYSEMIHREAAPSPRYLALFETLCDRYAPRLAREVRQLAQQLVSDLGYSASPITLVSLVRAGTPAGALLRRALVDYEDQPCHHFSVSIIRDRGIDTTALDYLLDQVGVDAKRTVFVDAWTAKGVITRELRSDMTRYNNTRRAKGKSTIQPRLAVISDIGGTADYAATCEDYAIPSGILNATVSGLVSRSVLNHQVPTGAFHGCVIYSDLAKYDQTRAFIERVAQHLGQHTEGTTLPSEGELTRQRFLMQEMLGQIQRDYGINDINHIKPGIAEATRVMLRRVPALLIVRDASHPDVEHLMLLAEEKSVPVDVCPHMPFHACSLIKTLARTEAH
ncbi:PELOTA RNA binding domain-containing protein [Marinobacter sp. LV10R510-11A]|uniref:cysteine protease StiP family protein n=1 Tax=Marinobacter sp. LV10R510-11A TaxID=1415568 RepID=UPI000BB96EDA|nr:cysteine protease StiP family protein [Marinobacter sp. LV10R510-11A]SOB76249.1 PELOTA RNA binding domain-containing protein [Marinobacter sp. LV10R510-11A]